MNHCCTVISCDLETSLHLVNESRKAPAILIVLNVLDVSVLLTLLIVSPYPQQKGARTGNLAVRVVEMEEDLWL